MLLDPETLELADRAPEIVELLGEDERFKLELPASQLEILTAPAATVSEAAADLLGGRRALAQAVGEDVLLAAAGAHPFSPARGRLNRSPRYDATASEYGCIAERQLVCALQVHVAPGTSDRALAIYNAARSYLPLLAALSANAPLYEGVDTGLASVRPLIGRLLPRQGVPPALSSWESYAEALTWGHAGGTVPEPAVWWWELRLHPRFGTLEFRVPDAQSAVADAAAIAAVIQALVCWLGERHDAGDLPPADSTWRIEENRWSACRHGVEGEMVDLRTGRRRPTRAWLEELLDAVGPVARSLRAEAELNHARRLVEVNGAIAQRQVFREGADAVARWLTERFLHEPDG